MKAIKKVYAKAFSPSFELNYNYLKSASNIQLDIDLLRFKLQSEEDSLQKRALLLQLEKLFQKK